MANVPFFLGFAMIFRGFFLDFEPFSAVFQ